MDIRGHKPDLLLLLGDNVYLPARYKPHNPAALRQHLKIQYDRLLGDPNFSALLGHMREGNRKVAAIWDDHDFLGGATYAQDFPEVFSDAAKAQFFESFGFAAQPPNIYRSFVAGDAKFVLLDCRSWRKRPGKASGHADDVLGTEQLQWLKGQLQHDGSYTIVCSALTLYNHPGMEHARWDQYPAARAELLGLLANRAGLLMLSGDIHRNGALDGEGVIELVSSGVSRRHQLWFWRALRNYAILDLDPQGIAVSFYEENPSNNKALRISLSDWRLPPSAKY